jgi:hypothetical protein
LFFALIRHPKFRFAKVQNDRAALHIEGAPSRQLPSGTTSDVDARWRRSKSIVLDAAFR